MARVARRRSSWRIGRLQQRRQLASRIAAFIEYGVIDRASGRMLWVRRDPEGVMKLSGQISIELTVDDFVQAADHQRRIEGLLDLIRTSYPAATLAMRERRERKALGLATAPGTDGVHDAYDRS